jgi:hypothetical protein
MAGPCSRPATRKCGACGDRSGGWTMPRRTGKTPSMRRRTLG